MVDHSGEITQLLQEARQGDPKAINHLYEAVYEELRHIAHQRLSRNRANTCGSPGENVPLDAVTVAVEDGIKMRGIDPFPARPASDRYSI